MAASGYTPISLYHSTTPAAAPTAGNLVDGELAINIADGKLYYKDDGGVVQFFNKTGTRNVICKHWYHIKVSLCSWDVLLHPYLLHELYIVCFSRPRF